MKVLLLSVVPIVVFVLGWLAARLNDKDRKELNDLRRLREDLMAQAAEHTALGDTFAMIAMDMLRNPGRKHD